MCRLDSNQLSSTRTRPVGSAPGNDYRDWKVSVNKQAAGYWWATREWGEVRWQTAVINFRLLASTHARVRVSVAFRRSDTRCGHSLLCSDCNLTLRVIPLVRRMAIKICTRWLETNCTERRSPASIKQMRLQHHGGTVVLKTSTHSILPATPQPPHVGCLPHRKNYAIKKIPQSVARALPASLTAITVRDVIDYTHTAAGRARRGQVVSSLERDAVSVPLTS